jgi:hypothetical protein
MGHIDLDTGEIFEGGMPMLLQPKRRNGFDDGWLAMTQGSQLMTFVQSDLTLTDYRVFFTLLNHVEEGNLIRTPQSEMAEKVGIARSHFSASVARLIEEGVIEKGEKNGRTTTLKLCSQYGWKGSAKSHVADLSEYRKRKQKEVPPKL